MKLLHTSDWHLGKKLEIFLRIEEQRLVLDEICEIADKENVDAVLIAGDLFDSFNPSTDSLELFYKILKRLSKNGKRAVIAIAGNHDSPERIDAPEPLARECGIILFGAPDLKISCFSLETGLAVINSDEGFIELKLPNCQYPLRLLVTPYANEYRLKKYFGSEDKEQELRDILQGKWSNLAKQYCDTEGVNILLTHLFVVNKGNSEDEPIQDDERSIVHVGGVQAVYSENIPSEVQYAALGHLHRNIKVEDSLMTVKYCGSPLMYSINDIQKDKSVSIIDIEPGQKAVCREIALSCGKKLIRKKFDNIVDAVEWLSDNKDCFVEITIRTNTYLMADEKKQLYDVHEGITNVIPELINEDLFNQDSYKPVDVSKNIEELFIDYFQVKKQGLLPGEDLMNVFKEIIGIE